MHRRRFLQTAAALGAPAGSPAPSAAKKPNVLILFTDDQRFSTIGALNNPEVRTPNLDALLARSTAMTSAFIMGGTVGAVCVPSRAMLMTGQSLFHIHRSIVAPQEQPAASRKPFTLMPEHFARNGYVTFGTGKWHNGPALYARCFQRGGSIFFGGMADHLRTPVFSHDPSGAYPKANASESTRFSSELFADEAIGFLRAYREDQPFFAYVAFTSPHDPRMAPKRFQDLYAPERIRLPENFLPEHPFDNGELKVRDETLAPWPRTPEVVRRHIADYYAMISEVDEQIGRILRALEESGRSRDTIVVFTADNGLAVGQHGLLGKQNLYDHSVRVPLLVSGPGVRPNQRRDGLCYLFDVLPTLCDLAGLPAPPHADGVSFAPALRGRPWRGRDSVFLAYRHVQRALRTRDWKLIRYNAGGRQTTQLFHIAADPWEMTNLAGDPAQAARLERMTALLKRWMKETADPLDLDKPDWGHSG